MDIEELNKKMDSLIVEAIRSGIKTVDILAGIELSKMTLYHMSYSKTKRMGLVE